MPSSNTPKELDEPRRVHSDGNRFCGNCHVSAEREGRRLLKCSSCESTWYCNRECQKADWKRHKPDCQRIKSERTALPQDQQKLIDAVTTWASTHQPIIQVAANNALLPSQGHLDNYLIDTHLLVIHLEETYPGSTELKVTNAYAAPREIVKILAASLDMDNSFETALRRRAEEIPHLEKSLGSKVVGSLWTLLHCGSLFKLHPTVITEKSLARQRQNRYRADWLDILKNATLPGSKQYMSSDGIITMLEQKVTR